MTTHHFTLGTAGHIDHGKTTLTRALTGVDTDSLKEEKERNISIEPGFAPLQLPSGLHTSIVDVPGHERFIRQMVSGVAGIDFVLFVIAADDGVMPQTREHLAILDLLGLKAGLIVLSKIDQADPELLPLIEEDIREIMSHTFLEGAPVLKVSSKTGEGIESLRQELDRSLSLLSPRKSKAPFRFPIDRVFTVDGAGTVTTGTIQSGSISAGDTMVLLPTNHKVKVRQLQVHHKTVDTAYAGQRVALNLTHIRKEEISRGQTLAGENTWTTTQRMDIQASLLPDLSFSLKQRHLVTLMIGTSEVSADLILYDRKEWTPGDKIFASLRLHQPVVAARGDRFILRRPTPSATVGGGWVIVPDAKPHKINPATAELIQTWMNASLAERILEKLSSQDLLQTPDTLARSLQEPETDIRNELEILHQKEKVIQLNAFYASRSVMELNEISIQDRLKDFHRSFPLRPGMSKAEWASRYFPQLPTRTGKLLLDYWEQRGLLRQTEEMVSLFTFRPSVPAPWQDAVEKVIQQIAKDALTPSDWSHYFGKSSIPQDLEDDLYTFLIRQKHLIPLTDTLLVHFSVFQDAVYKVKSFLNQQKTMTMQDAKTLFPLSRKYLVPLLEQMDEQGITKRLDNKRILA
ncbi:selenocysteine-specific translation elongation factor [Kroppenstedtia pulmonis]|uniref:Selenocysteine-specific elongation factor n=1 Tax=Kroppenstedtia pulmonis TaxID=1380685 RepID=A0A7D3XJK2_9BACL|nr:selenocysteine-specific translation elongation factor [Kroppenstedtia pulmonis]QKG84899.1 selenocysteine-specific translation elongation factor [Kroppenstedtia pulmonis]